MGTLIGMHYPTKLFLGAADHAYVRCDGSRAWGCWGGKSGGSEVRRGTGSTAQADAIAEPDERAGVTCYLINGVCHQSANRILLPAGITVRGVRGYSVSESLFGTYGRPRFIFGRCNAPFNTHGGVTGDLAECTPSGTVASGEPSAIDSPAGEPAAPASDEDSREQDYLAKVRGTYAKVEASGPSLTQDEFVDYQIELFWHKINYHFGEGFDTDLANKMVSIRKNVETRRADFEQQYAKDGMSLGDFVEAFNRETIRFQNEMADTLSSSQYQQFFSLNRDEAIVLADPDIIDAINAASGGGNVA